MYLQADSRERRLLNQAFFERIEIDSEKVSGCELAAPFAQLVASGPAAPAQRATAASSRPGSARGNGARKAKTPNPSSKVGGLDGTSLVDEIGEPTAAQKAYADNMAAACGVSVEGLEHLMKQDMKRKIAAMRMYGEQESPPTGG